MASSENLADAKPFSVAINELGISGGQKIKLPTPGITVIVGPNNVGKSTILRQANARSVQGFAGGGFAGEPLLVESMNVSIDGSIEDMLEWLRKHSSTSITGDGTAIFRRPNANEVKERDVPAYLQMRGERGLQALHSHFIFYGDATNRISSVQPTEIRDSIENPPMHPLHILQDNSDLFDELSQLCVRVFRKSLTLDAISKAMNIRIGTATVEAPPVNKLSPEYLDSLKILPRMENQGDGMRSFIGLLLPLLTSSYQVVLIDEPEAFLHPPQAVQLGQILGEQVTSRGSQIILATHDKNILAGLLQSEAEVSIVRLDRRDEGNTIAHQLSVESLKKVWTDPVLRHSNVLDGLFHKLVVLAEGDRDCTFFSAALEHLSAQHPIPVSPSEVLFVPSGGKGGLRLLIEVLTSAKVPTIASPDLDVLDDRTFLRRLIESLGGSWDEFEKNYDVATAPFRQPREKARVAHVLNSLNEVFRDRTDAVFDSEIAEEFRALTRARESPWSALKLHGEGAWNGNPQSALAAQHLLNDLDKLGIVAVRVGELERFANTLPVKKGSEWVPAAIAAGFHKERAAQEHVEKLVRFGLGEL
ncbi:ATP-dependent nuclease [Streptomyces sp. HUAS TT20]|uniref:ATP-dependent nuclease n=1 Tax=Streptomyces sp. HUAS TT20 TaxID=3447509 RepID=UPI0021DACD68|nr:AAA family ATPase [Streptomyces sp. HUAS 15-9]UXY27562.1 AAA family ATPase [Streptomyces sp. HUAS 15-9]